MAKRKQKTYRQSKNIPNNNNTIITATTTRNFWN